MEVEKIKLYRVSSTATAITRENIWFVGSMNTLDSYFGAFQSHKVVVFVVTSMKITIDDTMCLLFLLTRRCETYRQYECVVKLLIKNRHHLPLLEQLSSYGSRQKEYTIYYLVIQVLYLQKCAKFFSDGGCTLF